MRGSNKQSPQTTSKRKKFAEESDESCITQSTSQSAWNVMRFLVMQSNKVKTQGVKEIRNIHVRRNGVLKRTNTNVLTFNTPILPTKMKGAYISVNVEVYVPNPLRCYNCQFFGYHESRCTRKKYVQTVERLVDWGLTSHQQLRSYGDWTSVYSSIRRTEEPVTPGLQGE